MLQNSNSVSFVLGSYGSPRSMGSRWLNLSYFDEWREIEEELENEGFDLDGEDEELLILDIEGLPFDRNEHPRRLFDIVKASGILKTESLRRCAVAFLETYSFSDFADLVEKRGENWADELKFYEGMTLKELAEDLFFEWYNVPESLAFYIDFEKFAHELDIEGYNETKQGVIFWE